MQELELPELTKAYLQNILWVSVIDSLTQMFSCLSSIFLSIKNSSYTLKAIKTLSSVIPFNSSNSSLVHSSALELWAHTFSMPISFLSLLHHIFFAIHSTEYPLFVLYFLALK